MENMLLVNVMLWCRSRPIMEAYTRCRPRSLAQEADEWSKPSSDWIPPTWRITRWGGCKVYWRAWKRACLYLLVAADGGGGLTRISRSNSFWVRGGSICSLLQIFEVRKFEAEVVNVDKGLSGYDVPRMIVQRPEPLISEKVTLLCGSLMVSRCLKMSWC